MDYNDFSFLRQLDINKGDFLVVSSDITSYLLEGFRETGVFPDVNLLIDSLYELVGKEGTLVFPTFNWDYCAGNTFDWRKTEGKVGHLGNTALKRKDFKRTKHPIYSFVVKGKYQEELCSLNNTDSFGIDSPFAFFDKKYAKSLLFGIGLQEGFTFAHYAEQVGKAPYRYIKNFTAPYIDENGVEEVRTYSMFVRRLDLDVVADLSKLESLLINKKVAKRIVVNDIPYTIIDMHSSLPLIVSDVKNNRSRSLYSYKGQND